jgi:hypothetical protein
MSNAKITKWVAAALCVAGIAAVSTLVAGDEPTAPKPTKLDPLKRLVGEWLQVGEDGKATDVVMARSRLTAGGSAILEELFPGTDHEMVTLYHLDGADVVLTHYCVMGNAPRMKLEKGSTADKWTFVCDGKGSNMKESDPHMHKGTITFLSDDRFQSEWTMQKDGKPDHSAKFDCIRKK